MFGTLNISTKTSFVRRLILESTTTIKSSSKLSPTTRSTLFNHSQINPKNGYASLASSLPTQIGSASVFVPTMIYLLSPVSPRHSSVSTGDFSNAQGGTNSFNDESYSPTSVVNPGVSEISGPSRAGEAQGDKALRKMMSPVDTGVSTNQSNSTEPQSFKAIPEKMDEARGLATSGSQGTTNVSTKDISEKAHASHEEKKA
ncbi:expressed protein [Phakopsora pachyrhizi]|uniref:Expressed protein n=1 Tax=Phakopsora pachyrhizi TaxID=170000 RepID=A0AAV0B2E2_PHAPC|nr:expressed protein [Phakopsora pachyrhizi]